VAEVLAEQQKFFFLSIGQGVVLVGHDVVDALLQLLILLAFKGVQVEDKQVAFVATYVHQISVDQTTEHAVAAGLFDCFSL